jgi:hypothetical protein
VTVEVWAILLGGAVLVLLAWLTWTLVRLGRLEERVENAWAALDSQLQRRAGLAEELAREHPAVVGDERAGYLAAFAADARAPVDGDREMAENLLGRELRELPDDLGALPAALRNDLEGTMTRVGLARRFYNDAVRDLRALRRRRLARVFRLHASRSLPRFFDIDDRARGSARTDGASTDGAGRPRP